MKSIRKQTNLGICWKTLTVFLVALYFSAFTFPTFMGQHNHSGLSAFGSELSHVSHVFHGEDGSKPGAPDSHSHEDCQICQIQSTLAVSLLSSGTSFSLALLVQSYTWTWTSPCVQQFESAEIHLRGPPPLLSI